MANATFNELREALKEDTADDSFILRLFISAFVDHLDTERKKADEKEKKQTIINDKVNKMWPVSQLSVWLLGIFGTGFVGFVISLVTGQASIQINP